MLIGQDFRKINIFIYTFMRFIINAVVNVNIRLNVN